MSKIIHTAANERIVSYGDGTFALAKTQDVEPVIKAVQSMSNTFTRTQRKKSEMHYVGSIPVLVGVQWAKEWGVRLYSKEFMRLAAKRLKTDPNWAKLRFKPT